MHQSTPFGAVEFAANPEPRCACVLVLDCSASMAGQRLQELQRGLTQFREELLGDPLARKRVEVAVVTFGGSVKLACDFTTMEHFEPPRLQAEGLTPMGSAIATALDLLTTRKQVYRTNGVSYYRPWVFILTDGEPNDDWHAAVHLVRDVETSKQAAVFAVGIGEANFEVLRQIAVRQPLQLRGLMFREMFQWLSNSLKSVSHSATSEEVPLANPSGPEGWAKI